MKLTIPLLVKVATEVTNKVPVQLREPLLRAVNAGNKIMYAKETQHLVQNQMLQKAPVGTKIGEGVAKLIGIVWRDANGKLPMRIMIPAGVVLAMQAIEFMVDTKVIKPEEVDTALVDEVTQEFASSFLQLLGVTPEKLQGMLHQATSAYEQHVGSQPAEPAPQQAPQQQPPQQGGIVQGAMA
jgi:hypothetical protein